MCSVSEGEYVQVDVMVDSGATETVMTVDCLAGEIDITEEVALKNGVKYEVANGTQIPKLEER